MASADASAVVEASGVEWTGLTVLEVVAGGEGDDDGMVEFEARHVELGDRGVMRERSLFERRGGRWTYVAADPAGARPAGD